MGDWYWSNEVPAGILLDYKNAYVYVVGLNGDIREVGSTLQAGKTLAHSINCSLKGLYEQWLA
jgi:hypothetical protein